MNNLDTLCSRGMNIECDLSTCIMATVFMCLFECFIFAYQMYLFGTLYKLTLVLCGNCLFLLTYFWALCPLHLPPCLLGDLNTFILPYDYKWQSGG